MPPSLVGAYYSQPPDARAIFLHNDFLCNDTCSVTGGSITYWGGGHERKKIPDFGKVRLEIIMHDDSSRFLYSTDYAFFSAK